MVAGCIYDECRTCWEIELPSFIHLELEVKCHTFLLGNT